MPRITISEKDSTLIASTDVTQNIVYVPGIGKKSEKSTYANKPKLYTSAAEFEKDFDEYVFNNDQVVGDFQAGEYEKSYLYTIDLLASGLQVLYEQVIDVEDYEVGELVELTPTTIESLPVPNNTIYVVNAVPNLTEEQFNQGEYYTKNTNTEYAKAYEYDSSLSYYAITLAQEYVAEGVDYFTIEVIPATINDSTIVEDFYKKLSGTTSGSQDNPTITSVSIYEKLLDRWTYNFKYLTCGGYSTLTIANTSSFDEKILPQMLIVCGVRGDAIALIDTPENIKLETVYSYINNLSKESNSYKVQSGGPHVVETITYTTPQNRLEESTLKYGAIIGPVGIYELSAVANPKTIKLPGSFGYLKCLANAINTYKSPNYFAIAGVTRGKVPSLKSLDTDVPGAVAELVQQKTTGQISINPIANVQGYGLCIWGNRTLYPNQASDQLIASSFLNIRVMVADVKKTIYAACKKYTFETNSTELWLKFKSEITPLLDKMVADGALEDYNLIKNTTTEKATLSVTVQLVTLYAVEDFDITVELTDSTVEVAE